MLIAVRSGDNLGRLVRDNDLRSIALRLLLDSQRIQVPFSSPILNRLVLIVLRMSWICHNSLHSVPQRRGLVFLPLLFVREDPIAAQNLSCLKRIHSILPCQD
ncbi:hypothetical protein A5906_13665 [Bradyrhizobium sacchari]|nr:hypothetical protein A5906_13665 [Bradyrhizobium sacchari]